MKNHINKRKLKVSISPFLLFFYLISVLITSVIINKSVFAIHMSQITETIKLISLAIIKLIFERRIDTKINYVERIEFRRIALIVPKAVEDVY